MANKLTIHPIPSENTSIWQDWWLAAERMKAQGEHEHVCGVPTCGNSYRCHGTRCAGTVWLCPACELDQRDDYLNSLQQNRINR